MRYVLLAAMTVIATVSASAAQAQQWVGKWEGGPATCAEPFEFTARTYRPPGGDVMTILSVAQQGREYVFKFSDGYSFTVGNVTATSMSWLSGATGDAFALTKCR